MACDCTTTATGHGTGGPYFAADPAHAERIARLGTLTASIVHEVNQPLSAIVTSAEASLRWLSRPDADLARVAQLTRSIAESARRAGDIIAGTLAMARPQGPARTLLDIDALVEDSLSIVGADAESRAIELIAQVAPGLPAIPGDRVQLQQVLTNLLRNAIQAIDASSIGHGRIELSASVEAGEVSIAVRDNGGGIAPDDLARVFDAYFTTRQDGVGVGLAICRAIVAGHGGSLGGSNRPEGGAEFHIRLPLPAKETGEASRRP